MKKFLSALFFIGLLATAGGAFWLLSALPAAGPLTEEKLVYIAPGSSGLAIARKLQEEGAIGDTFLFRLAAKIYAASGSLKAGEYKLPAAASIKDIVALLQSGRTHQRFITLPEGLMSFELVTLINTGEAMTGTLETIPPDGSLLPETYSYSYGEARENIISRAQKSMDETLAALWETRVQNLPLKTPQEALVLASIVEKETGIAAERAQVAGVFINRLNKGMPLQSDPTTIYALTEGKYKLDRELRRKDLTIVSPFNTYVAAGLPPAPIANPGRAAIAATLNPDIHDYLYFVADGTGGHAFGKTLDDHTRNVAQWRQIQKTKQ